MEVGEEGKLPTGSNLTYSFNSFHTFSVFIWIKLSHTHLNHGSRRSLFSHISLTNKSQSISICQGKMNETLEVRSTQGESEGLSESCVWLYIEGTLKKGLDIKVRKFAAFIKTS